VSRHAPHGTAPARAKEGSDRPALRSPNDAVPRRFHVDSTMQNVRAAARCGRRRWSALDTW